MKLSFVFDDGGRQAAGFKGHANDCVTRSIAIATGRQYIDVYDTFNAMGKRERTGKRKRGKSSAREGVYTRTIRRYMDEQGWTWVPTMRVGSGCTTHLRAGELPMGRIVVTVSKHVTAVIDGVIHDTHDPSRDGMRCVYGYWIKREGE